MKVFNYKSVKAENADCCSQNTQVRWLLTKEIGAKNFAMRLFEMAPGGFSPLHKHPWEHEVFVLEGEGLVFDGQKALPLQAGDVAFVMPNEQHQFKNNSDKPFKFLCLIPNIKK
jgi:quercetin dioxygenase-like cupin family protein